MCNLVFRVIMFEMREREGNGKKGNIKVRLVDETSFL